MYIVYKNKLNKSLYFYVIKMYLLFMHYNHKDMIYQMSSFKNFLLNSRNLQFLTKYKVEKFLTALMRLQFLFILVLIKLDIFTIL